MLIVHQVVGVLTEQFLGRIPEQRGGGAVDECAVPPHVHTVKALVCGVEQQPVIARHARLFLLGALAFLARLLEVSDIGAVADPLADAAVVVQDRYAAGEEVAVGAVVAPDAELGVVGALGLDRARPLRHGVCAVVGVDGVEPAKTFDFGGALTRVGAPGRHIVAQSRGRGRPGELARGLGERLIAVLIDVPGLVDGLRDRVQRRHLARRRVLFSLVDRLRDRLQRRALFRCRRGVFRRVRRAAPVCLYLYGAGWVLAPIRRGHVPSLSSVVNRLLGRGLTLKGHGRCNLHTM